MSNVNDRSNSHSDTSQKDPYSQYPVDAYVGSVGKVSFDTNGPSGDFIRMVVMSDTVAAGREARREYIHNNPAISIDDVPSFTVRYAVMRGEEIDAFLGVMPQQLTIAQAPDWRCGVYRPTEARQRLYKALDPDEQTKMIGVLLEQNSEGRLSRITWYKTRSAKAIFEQSPKTLEFEAVKTAAGERSTNPNDIGGWTWYFTTSTSPSS